MDLDNLSNIQLDALKEVSNIGAHFYYIPVPGSFEKILKSIGVY